MNFVVRFSIVVLSLGLAASSASAVTIGHAASRPQVQAGATGSTSALSSMPYACDRTELKSHIEKRTCR